MNPERQRCEPLFRQFMDSYPRRVDQKRAFDVFVELVSEGCDPSMLIAKAESYRRNTDPENLKYVPSPRTWLRDRRFEDEDLFTDRFVTTREWFVTKYQEADAASVARKYGFVYPDPPIPDGVTDVEKWCYDDRRKWIGQIANHVLHKHPLPE